MSIVPYRYDVDLSWYETFRTVVSDDSPLGVQLTSDELSNILSTIIEETQKITLNKFLERWNNTGIVFYLFYTPALK